MGLVFVATGFVFIGSNPVDIFHVFFDSLGRIDLIFWLLVNWLLVLIIVADFFYYELNIYAWVLLVVFELAYLSYTGDILTAVIAGLVLGAVFILIYR